MDFSKNLALELPEPLVSYNVPISVDTFES